MGVLLELLLFPITVTIRVYVTLGVTFIAAFGVNFNKKIVDFKPLVQQNTASCITICKSSREHVEDVEQALVDKVMSNSLILQKIMEYSSGETVINFRLVSKFWNQIILSLPNPKFSFRQPLRQHWKSVVSTEYQDICEQMNPMLVKRFFVFSPRDNYFQPCIQMFGEYVQDMTVCLEIMHIPFLHRIFQSNSFQNLKSLVIEISNKSFPRPDYREIMLDIPIKPTLEYINIYHDVDDDPQPYPIYTINIAQLLVNAAINLRKLHLICNTLPDLSINKNLESFIFYDDENGIGQPGSDSFSPKRLSLILHQVASSVKHVELGNLSWIFQNFDHSSKMEFVIPNMPQLESFTYDGRYINNSEKFEFW